MGFLDTFIVLTCVRVLDAIDIVELSLLRVVCGAIVCTCDIGLCDLVSGIFLSVILPIDFAAVANVIFEMLPPLTLLDYHLCTLSFITCARYFQTSLPAAITRNCNHESPGGTSNVH